MIALRWLVRLATRLGLRWLVASVAARFLARRLTRSQVARATAELETRARDLPAPVARVVASLPPEAKEVGGSALVAGRAARTVVGTTRRVGHLARGASRRGAAAVGGARGVADGLRHGVGQVRSETDASRRRLRAQYLATTVGPEAATDSLLDLRQPDQGPASGMSRRPGPGAATNRDPHDRVPGPVRSGRTRARRSVPSPVNRRRRTYQPAPKPWE